MMGIKFSSRNFGDDYYYVDFFERYISDYDLDGLSNGGILNTPNITSFNPLAMEYSSVMNGSGESDGGILPAIGVEFMDGDEDSGKIIGEGAGSIEINTDFLDSLDELTMKERFCVGVFISDNNITKMRSLLTEREGRPLYARRNLKFENITLNVSVWTSDPQHARLMRDVVRSLIQLSKEDVLKRGGTEITKSTNGSLYNYDFSKTLFGAEIKINYKNKVSDWEVDESIEQINYIQVDSKFVAKGGGTDFLLRSITAE